MAVAAAAVITAAAAVSAAAEAAEEEGAAEEAAEEAVDITAHLGGTASTANQLNRSASPVRLSLPVSRHASTPISNLGSLVG